MWYELLSRGIHNFYEYSWLRDLVESEISFKEVIGALLERKREEGVVLLSPRRLSSIGAMNG